MKFCPECAAPLTLEIPEGDNRERHVCRSCSTIHYRNPRIVAGTVPMVEDRILLCRRAIEPRKGYWTLPAGFMELGESVEEAAARETWEEAAALIHSPRLYSLINIPYIGQVHLFYLAQVVDGKYGIGPESLESALFAMDEIPWEELSFRSVSLTLKALIAEWPDTVATQPHEWTLETPPGWSPTP